MLFPCSTGWPPDVNLSPDFQAPSGEGFGQAILAMLWQLLTLNHVFLLLKDQPTIYEN